MSNEVPNVNTKNTKSAIYDAYLAAMDKIENLEKNVNPREEATRKRNQEIVTKATNSTIEEVVNDLSSTRVRLNEAVAGVESELVEKRTKLSELQTAIRTEEESLAEIHNITRQADTLAALIQAQKDERTRHQESMDEIRANWEQEKKEYAQRIQERNAETAKTQKREQEEYTYSFKKQKELDQDAFEVEKRTRLRDLDEHERTVREALDRREQELSEREEELEELRQKVEDFPAELERAVEEARADAKSRAEKSHAFETRAIKKDKEAMEELLTQKISTLERQVDELTEERRELRDRVEKSSGEIRDIATQAIKGAQEKHYHVQNESKK